MKLVAVKPGVTATIIGTDMQLKGIDDNDMPFRVCFTGEEMEHLRDACRGVQGGPVSDTKDLFS